MSSSRRDGLRQIAALALTAGSALLPPAARGAAPPHARLVATEFPPYTSATLPGGGIACAITRAALERSGWTMSLAFRPWARALSEFRQGLHDGVIGTWHSAERAATMRFPRDLGLINRIGFMARAGSGLKVEELSQLAGLRIGTVLGYANPERFERARLTLDPAVDDLANLRKLLAGRVELALIDKGVAFHLLDTELREQAARLAWLEPALSEVPLYTVFAKGRMETERMAAAFDTGLAQLQSGGRVAELLRQGARWQ